MSNMFKFKFNFEKNPTSSYKTYNLSTDYVNVFKQTVSSSQFIRRPCLCGSNMGLSLNQLNPDQKKLIYYIETLTKERNFEIAIIILDGGPGCGKSAMLSFIMSRMRHLFNRVRLITEKLINLEDHHKSLCPAHLIQHAGLNYEKYEKSPRVDDCIMSCTVSKMIYDIMGEKNTDGEKTKCMKRESNEIINNENSYRSEIEAIIDQYLFKFKTYYPPGSKDKLNLYIIDEYAMIPPEKIYFLIGYLHRRDPKSHHMFILSGDVDQVEPIGHETGHKIKIDPSKCKESWFPVGMCSDIDVVCKSVIGNHRCIIEKFVLTEPARCVNDVNLVNFIKQYKTTNDDEGKEIVLDKFIRENLSSLFGVYEIPVDGKRIDDFVSGAADYIDLGFKIIVRSNQCMHELNEILFDQIINKYPEIAYKTAGGDMLVSGMPYTLTQTIDPSKTLCNRNVVVLSSVDLDNTTGEIHTIVVFKITDPNRIKYRIGPVYDDEKKDLKFPIQMEFVDNSYQIQGKTIKRNLYLDMLNCSKEHRYVMITRAMFLNQIKSVLNFV